MKWYCPSEKMPKVGDHIYVSDGEKVINMVVESLPNEPYEGCVTMWRYVDGE